MAVVYARVTGIQPDITAVLLVVLGALAPDIDGGGTISKPGKILNRLLPRRTARVLDELGSTISSFIGAIFGHRGFFHWLILPAAMMAGGVLLKIPWLYWFGLGYLSHIAADFCTAGGVPILAPFYQRPLSCSKMKTGSLIEAAIFFALVLTMVVLGWTLLPIQTQEGFWKVYDAIISSKE